jgi:hypothetical protein
MVVGSAVGLALSVTGVVIGWRRLWGVRPGRPARIAYRNR